MQRLDVQELAAPRAPPGPVGALPDPGEHGADLQRAVLVEVPGHDAGARADPGGSESKVRGPRLQPAAHDQLLGSGVLRLRLPAVRPGVRAGRVYCDASAG